MFPDSCQGRDDNAPLLSQEEEDELNAGSVGDYEEMAENIEAMESIELMENFEPMESIEDMSNFENQEFESFENFENAEEMENSVVVNGNHQTMENQPESNNSIDGFSVARDILNVGTHAVPIGFGIARQGVNLGFGITNGIMSGLATIGDVFAPSGGSIFRGVNVGISLAHQTTIASLNASEMITNTSLQVSNQIFEGFSVDHGGLLQLCGMGSLTSNALINTIRVLKDHLGEIWNLGTAQVLEKLFILSYLQQKFETYPDGEECGNIDELTRYMSLVSAIYGPMMLTFFGAANIPSSTLEAIKILYGDVEIFAQTDSSEVYRPAYAICVDLEHKKILVAFRGTLSIVDALSDLDCDPVPLEFCGVNGYAHKGFVECGKAMYEILTPLVACVLEEYPDFQVVVCGHSLGAACATVVTMNWIETTNWNLRGYLYAPPCVLSENLATHPSLMSRVENFIIGSDMVPRFGRATTKDLTRQVEFLINSNLTSEVMLNDERFYNNLVQTCCIDEPKLYPCGKCHFAPTFDAVAKIFPNTFFNKILIDSTMIKDHLPDNLLKRGNQL